MIRKSYKIDVCNSLEEVFFLIVIKECLKEIWHCFFIEN